MEKNPLNWTILHPHRMWRSWLLWGMQRAEYTPLADWFELQFFLKKGMLQISSRIPLCLYNFLNIGHIGLNWIESENLTSSSVCPIPWDRSGWVLVAGAGCQGTEVLRRKVTDNMKPPVGGGESEEPFVFLQNDATKDKVTMMLQEKYQNRYL